jgi:uncharacterized protein HemX
MADPTAGEAGGIFAGAVALLIAVGHGVRGWTDRRAATRAAKLDAWQRQLEDRERRVDEKQDEHWRRVERELGQLRSEHAALLGGYQLIAAALRLLDPGSDALKRADDLLRAAFPLEPCLPGDMTATVRKIDRGPSR